MVLVTRADGRRIFALGVAGLVPAALVTLLLVHQPSIGGRRLYPMLRGPLVVAGLALAVVTLVAWTRDRNRFGRSSLSGLAWAGLTGLLCIGPLIESTPRARLYALQLDDGDVAWTWKRAVKDPVLMDGVLYVTDVGSDDMLELDPLTGELLDRGPRTDEYLAARADTTESGPQTTPSFPGETVAAVTHVGDDGYAYVLTTGAAREPDPSPGGAIAAFDVAHGTVRWRVALPEQVAVRSGTPAIDANETTVVVAGGEHIAALDVDDDDEGARIDWSQSIASLGKSRGYVLPGSVQEVIVTGVMVYLLATPRP